MDWTITVMVELLQLQLDGLNSSFLLCKGQEKQSDKQRKQGKQHPKGQKTPKGEGPKEGLGTPKKARLSGQCCLI